MRVDYLVAKALEGARMTAYAQGAGAKPPHLLAVQVSFPESGQEQYRAEVTPDTTIEAILFKALEHFDEWHTELEVFVLTRDGHREPEDRAIGDIAGDKENVIRFQLDYRPV